MSIYLSINPSITSPSIYPLAIFQFLPFLYPSTIIHPSVTYHLCLSVSLLIFAVVLPHPSSGWPSSPHQLLASVTFLSPGQAQPGPAQPLCHSLSSHPISCILLPILLALPAFVGLSSFLLLSRWASLNCLHIEENLPPSTPAHSLAHPVPRPSFLSLLRMPGANHGNRQRTGLAEGWGWMGSLGL